MLKLYRRALLKIGIFWLLEIKNALFATSKIMCHSVVMLDQREDAMELQWIKVWSIGWSNVSWSTTARMHEFSCFRSIFVTIDSPHCDINLMLVDAPLILWTTSFNSAIDAHSRQKRELKQRKPLTKNFFLLLSTIWKSCLEELHSLLNSLISINFVHQDLISSAFQLLLLYHHQNVCCIRMMLSLLSKKIFNLNSESWWKKNGP